MFDLVNSGSSRLRNVNRSVLAGLASFVLTLAGSHALAQETASEPKAAPAEASEPKPAASAEATQPEQALPAPEPAPPPPEPVPPPPPAAKPEAPPAVPPAPKVEWKAQSKGGFVMTSGNSQATNVTFGVNGSRKEGNNKLELEAGVAYGRSKNLVATTGTDPNTGSTVITSLDRQAVTSTNNWATKARYDRFLSANNVAYASTQWAGDKIAGKTLFGGGQVGYSRQLRKDKWNLVLAELGYDFSYERYVQQPNKTIDPVTIHSARVLVGETLSLTSATGLTASVEALFNLNHEKNALNATDGSTGVDAFHDTRINGKLGISTNLFKKLALGLTFTVKYDQNPAPRPVPSSAPAGTSYPAGYQPWEFAEKVDTLTEVTLLYSFF
jgi:Protein of unknown function, DUF481